MKNPEFKCVCVCNTKVKKNYLGRWKGAVTHRGEHESGNYMVCTYKSIIKAE